MSQILPHLVIFFLIGCTYSQDGTKSEFSEDLIDQFESIISDQFDDQIDGEEGWDEWHVEILKGYISDPLDLNHVTIEELGNLSFLSELDIINIIQYREHYGPFVSIYELQSIHNLSLYKVRLLANFVAVYENRNPIEALKAFASHDFNELRFKWKGRTVVQNALRNYSNDYFYLNWRRKLAGKYQMGISLENDAGERWGQDPINLGFDYMSLFLQVEKPIKKIDRLILGDFSLSLGQGLVAFRDFGFEKTSLTTLIKKKPPTVRGYTSINENEYLRGLAASIRFHPSISGLVFSSFTRIDANLISGPEGISDNAFSSFQNSGYHRSQEELTDRKSVRQQVHGGQLRIRPNGKMQVGINGLVVDFDKALMKRELPYNKFRFSGNQLANTSIDFSLFSGSVHHFGELAWSSNGGIAWVQGLMSSLHPDLDVAMLFRYYDKGYESILADAFGEFSDVNDELGFYLGIEGRLSQNWQINAYVDTWRHNWLKFNSSFPGGGNEGLIKITYRQKRKKEFYFQYKYEQKKVNRTGGNVIATVVPKRLHKIRFHTEYHLDHRFRFRARTEFSIFERDHLKHSGWLLFFDLHYASEMRKLKTSLRLSVFDIPSFDTRIYVYENDLQGEYNNLALIGRGLRCAINLKYALSRVCKIEWKLAVMDKMSDNTFLTESKVLLRFNF